MTAESDASSDLDRLIDHVALTYHEARNVRHLIKAGILEGTPWKYLVALPANRVEAWRALVPLREEARRLASAPEILKLFASRFHVTLTELISMFANSAWRGSGCGGNAWESIARAVSEYSEAVMSHSEDGRMRAYAELRAARHNNGSVSEKLEGLERSVAGV